MKKALLRLLKLFEKKYGGFHAIIFFDDGSGKIVRQLSKPYNQEFDFNNVDELIAHLSETAETEELGEVQMGMGSGKD